MKTDLSQAIIGRYRELKGFWRWVFISFSGCSLMLSIYYIFGMTWAEKIIGMMMTEGYLGLMFSLYLPLVFLLIPATASDRRDRVPWYDIVLFFLGLPLGIYMYLHVVDILYYGWGFKAPTEAFVMGLITWGLLLEASRRVAGNALAVIVGIFSVYPLFAQYCPGFLKSRSIPLDQLVAFQFLGETGAIKGMLMSVLATLLIGFMIFGVALQATGGADIFRMLSLRLMGRFRGGAAKVSVLVSALFSMLSGSALSNVLTTGVFTIPAMKKTGFTPRMAGAIEACASSGGTVTPPVMGAAAFLIVQFLNIPYAEVCLAAAIPAAIYFFTLLLQVDFYSAKSDLHGLSRDEIIEQKGILKTGWFLIVAVIVLLYFIFFQMMEARAPFWAILVLLLGGLITNFFGKEKVIGIESLIHFVEGSGKLMVEIIGVLGPIGLILGALSLTGSGVAFANALTELAQGNLVLLLLFSAIASFILGMGLPVTACYIFLAILVAPALINHGIYPLSAHLFVLYLALCSFVTPPVAIAAYVAASLAGADGMKTGFTAMRMGIMKFLLPFVFVLNPALLLHGTGVEILITISSVMAGAFLISAGFELYVLGLGRVRSWVMLPFFLSGLLLLLPFSQPRWTGLIAGLGTIGFLYLEAYRSRSRENYLEVK